jgi:DNA-binding transcriptional LysR family regulator
MDDRDYQFLIDLYESRNITKVAQMHFLSQPAMTKRIKRIEEELGCELVLRSKKGVMFTSIGESIIQHCRGMVQLSQSLRSCVNQHQGVVGGTVNIVSSFNYCRYRLPSAIKLFTQRYPMVEMNITTGKSKNIYYQLFQKEDCIIIVRGEQNWDGGCILLSSEPMCLIYSHENAGRPLSEYDYIGHHTDAKVEAQINQWAKEKDISLYNTRLWVDDISSCMELVRSGIGWCIVPRICLDSFDGIVENVYFADGTPLTRSTYALYHDSYRELQQVRLFLDVLVENEGNITAAITV